MKSFIAGVIIGAAFMFPFAVVGWLEIFNAAIAENNMRLAKTMMLQIERIRDNNGPVAEDCVITAQETRCKAKGKFIQIVEVK